MRELGGVGANREGKIIKHFSGLISLSTFS